MLFNEDYLKRKHFLEVGNNVMINARIDECVNQKGNFMIRVSDMYLLSEAMSKMAKSITLNLNASDLNDDFVKQLASMAKEYSGVCALQFRIEDPDDGKILTMKTSKFRVEPRAFVQEVKKLKQLSYMIN